MSTKSSDDRYRENRKGLGKIQAKTLLDAMCVAIDFSRMENVEKYDACCLQVEEDGTFSILNRCYSNTSFSTPVTYGLRYSLMTVSSSNYPGQPVPFNFAHFCATFGIPICDSPIPENK